MSLEATTADRKLLRVYWLLFGLLVCVFSLNGVLRHLANQWPGTRTSAVLQAVASIPDTVYQTLPGGGPHLLFELFLRWVVILLGAHLVLLLIASLRHRSPVIFVSGVAGLFIGLFSLTWLSLLIVIVMFLYAVIMWILNLLKLVLGAIASFFLWGPVFYTLLTLIGIVAIAGLIALFKGLRPRDTWERVKEWLRNMTAKPLVLLLLISVTGAVIWFVGIPLWQQYISPVLQALRNWFSQYITPVLSWLGSILVLCVGAIVAVLLALLAVGVLGWQFSDQFTSARACGRNTHKSFEAGFAIGAAMALVLLICAANPTFKSLVNVAWFETSPVLSSMDLSTAVFYFMPASIEVTLHNALVKASMPVFDVAALLVTLLVSSASLITGLLSRVTIEPLRALLEPDRLPPLGKVLFGVLIPLGAVVAESAANEDA